MPPHRPIHDRPCRLTVRGHKCNPAAHAARWPSCTHARRALKGFLGFPVVLQPDTTAERLALHHAALQLATEYGLPAAYDAHYVALARMLGCTFWTDDRRLLRSLNGRLGFVRWIGDFTPSAAH